MERCYDLEDVANNNGILYEIYYISYKRFICPQSSNIVRRVEV